jgi:hypothetical protein
VPCQAVLYLANANVVSLKQHLADNSPVAIALVVSMASLCFLCVLVEYRVGKVREVFLCAELAQAVV